MQVQSLTEKCSKQDMEMQKVLKNVQVAVSLATEQSSKCTAANEVLKTITAQVSTLVNFLSCELLLPW